MERPRRFSDKERDDHLYQARMNYLREQSAIRGDFEEMEEHLAETRRLMDEALAAKEQERSEKEAAMAEVERLKALLAERNPR